jgi:hypothetical protein
MNYPAAFQDFFKSPKWTMNLLLGAVCCIIPPLGAIVLMGWLFGGFWGRADGRSETFPDLDFNKFGKYLERGLWPALIWMIGWLVMIPVIIVVAISMALIVGSGGFAGFLSGVLYVAIFAALSFFLLPVVLRAGLMQDFGAAFNMPFLKRFVELTKTELAVSVLVLAVAGFVMMLLGKVFCVGYLLALAAIVVITYAWAHLAKQLYALYIARGGEPLVISPKLGDDPPLPPPTEPAPPVGPVA